MSTGRLIMVLGSCVVVPLAVFVDRPPLVAPRDGRQDKGARSKELQRSVRPAPGIMECEVGDKRNRL